MKWNGLILRGHLVDVLAGNIEPEAARLMIFQCRSNARCVELLRARIHEGTAYIGTCQNGRPAT